MEKNKKIRVAELFAGVGGFRVGLERANNDLFQTVWANQWEPQRKTQDAFDCYIRNFKTGNPSNEDIGTVESSFFQELKPDLVVGGFPCQDYSVARSLSGENGIQGKKGVLFWEIERLLENSHPKYVLLENVDRLLKSPSSQRGKDFGVMLTTFWHLDYSVEWRVINAADYGFAQRRRRVFIFAYKNDIEFDKKQRESKDEEIVFKNGFFAESFHITEKPYKGRINRGKLPADRVEITDNFSFEFYTSGLMRDGKIYTAHTNPVQIEPVPLKDILISEKDVDKKFYLTEKSEEKFSYLRGAKKIKRTSDNGYEYYFSEGGMSEMDILDRPGRTMLTSEGTVNRSTHIIEVDGRKRFLTPTECERLNGFDDNWTEGMSDRMRYFCMGNALVVDLVEKMGKRIEEIEELNKDELVQLEMF